MHGMKPDFEAYAAPTEHPLFLALCALVGLVGTDGERLIVLVCVLSPRGARVGHLPRRRRVLRAVAGPGGRRLRGLELRLPALRRARLRRRALPGARAVGRGARGARAAPRPAGHGDAGRGRAAAPRGVGAGRRLLAVVRLAAPGPARARRRRAAGVVPGRPVGHRRSALLAARHQRPRRRAQPQPRAVLGPGLVRVVRDRHGPARRSRWRPRRARCCCGGCAPGAPCTCRSRSSAPAWSPSWPPGWRGSRCCRAT